MLISGCSTRNLSCTLYRCKKLSKTVLNTFRAEALGSRIASGIASGSLRELCANAWPRRISKMAEGSESQPNNPLSRKLNKILETRLDNDKVTTFLYLAVFHTRKKNVIVLQNLLLFDRKWWKP